MGEIKVSNFRDEQIAEDVAKKAMLGWFDVEFIMYGCAYLDPKTDKMCYRISSREEDIYDFVEKSVRYNIYPGKVMSIRKRYPLPSGMREFVAEEVKRELARTLKRSYPKAFFYELYHMAKSARNNAAAPYLWDMVDCLEGVFEEEKLNDFEEQLQYFYSCHRLEPSSYHQLCEWLASERKNMQDDYVNSDLFKKTMYGFLYEKDGYVKYMADAQRANIYRNICELEERGAKVSPIYVKTYWYNRNTPLTNVVSKFKERLKNKIELGEWEKIKNIRNGNNNRIADYEQTIANIRETYGMHAAETVTRYGCHWGIL